MPSTKRKKVKNSCKVCLEAVNDKTGIQCQGACKKWAHFKCLSYTPGKILDIKKGYVQVRCPCPNCEIYSSRKENPLDCTRYYCGKSQYPDEPENSLCPEKNSNPDSVTSCLNDWESVTDAISILSLCKTNKTGIQEKISSPLSSWNNVSLDSCLSKQDTNSETEKVQDYKQMIKDSLESRHLAEGKLRHPDVQVKCKDNKRPHVKKNKPKHNHSRTLLKEVLTETEKDNSPGRGKQLEKTDHSEGKRSRERKTCEKNESYELPVAQPRSTTGVLTHNTATVPEKFPEYGIRTPIGVLTESQRTVTITTSTTFKPEEIHQTNFKYVSENTQTNQQTEYSNKNLPKTKSQSTYVSSAKKRRRHKVRTKDTHTCPSSKHTIPLFASAQESLSSIAITDSSGSKSDIHKDQIHTNSLYRQTLRDRKSQNQKAEPLRYSFRCQKSFGEKEAKRCKSDSCLIGSFSGLRNPLFNAMEQFNDVMGQCRDLMDKICHFFKRIS